MACCTKLIVFSPSRPDRPNHGPCASRFTRLIGRIADRWSKKKRSYPFTFYDNSYAGKR